jgi:two-component system, NarL family, sensor histidine kinase UhpB
MARRLATLPLFWRVLLTNAGVLALATAALALGPFTVSVPIAFSQLLVLLAGLVIMIALNLVLLRPALAPLHALAETMRRLDPLEPGRRAPVPGDPDVAALARAFNDMLARLEDERRESAQRALMLQEQERKRVARELHDEVGQTLTGIMLQIETLSARVPKELGGPVDELRETARAGAEDVRRIAKRLRPEALDELGLRSALAALTTAFAEQASLELTRRLEPIDGLSGEQELVIYRVAQEALTNVARHAEAAHADVRLTQRDGSVTLTVRDDGRGLPPDALSASDGIRGMRERALLVGGRIDIGPAEGGGTLIVLHVPTR